MVFVNGDIAHFEKGDISSPFKELESAARTHAASVRFGEKADFYSKECLSAMIRARRYLGTNVPCRRLMNGFIENGGTELYFG